MVKELSFLLLFSLVSCNPLGGGQEGSVKGEDYNPGLQNTTPFVANWPFAVSSDYTFTSGVIELANNNAKLTGTDQVDDDNSQTGFAGGTLRGAAWDGTNGYVRLGSGGGCSGTATACANQSAACIYELGSTWTPQWSNLVSY